MYWSYHMVNEICHQTKWLWITLAIHHCLTMSVQIYIYNSVHIKFYCQSHVNRNECHSLKILILMMFICFSHDHSLQNFISLFVCVSLFLLTGSTKSILLIMLSAIWHVFSHNVKWSSLILYFTLLTVPMMLAS